MIKDILWSCYTRKGYNMEGKTKPQILDVAYSIYDQTSVCLSVCVCVSMSMCDWGKVYSTSSEW